MTDELKPCPFCGGDAETCSYYFEEKDRTSWQVRCKERPYDVEHPCYTADSFISFATEAEAVEAWNTRAERTCKIENAGKVPENIIESETVWFCSECGSPIYNDMTPSYCIYCGAKVVG